MVQLYMYRLLHMIVAKFRQAFLAFSFRVWHRCKLIKIKSRDLRDRELSARPRGVKSLCVGSPRGIKWPI